MSAAVNAVTRRHIKIDALLRSNTYLLLLLVFVIYSLIIMVVRLLATPGTPVSFLAEVYDNLICVLFLTDFVLRLLNEPVKRDYFIGKRGYFDLLGSIPSFGIFQFVALLRLFRIWRLVRIWRVVGAQNRKMVRDEVLHNRGKYALFITVTTALLVLMSASILVLAFESQSSGANITTGGDALWWAIVTITTVGYGDKYPITPGGRVTGVFVMVTGLGIIGALASILASVLIPQPKQQEEPTQDVAASLTAMERKFDRVNTELIALRHLMEKANGDQKPPE